MLLFDGCVDPLLTIAATLPCSKWSVLLWKVLMQDARSEVPNVFRQLQLNLNVDDVNVHMRRKIQEVLQAVRKVVSKPKSVIQEANCKLSLMEG